MKRFDTTKLEEDLANGKFLNIGSVATYVNNINRLFKTIEGQLDDYEIFYRGHADKTYQEIPSIYRRDNYGNLWVEREDELCDEIMRECPADFSDFGSAFEKLVKMQHYELPTRLLDISENPLVALYFACLPVERNTNNGQILVYFIPKTEICNHSDQAVNKLSSISFVSNDSFKKSKTPNIRQLEDEMRSLTTYLTQLNNEHDFEKTICVRAKKSNPRIIRQHGAFFLFGAKDGDKMNIADLQFSCFKMDVSHTNKKQILRELERYGISEKSLFPEIDKVAHHIKTH